MYVCKYVSVYVSMYVSMYVHVCIHLIPCIVDSHVSGLSVHYRVLSTMEGSRYRCCIPDLIDA